MCGRSRLKRTLCVGLCALGTALLAVPDTVGAVDAETGTVSGGGDGGGGCVDSQAIANAQQNVQNIEAQISDASGLGDPEEQRRREYLAIGALTSVGIKPTFRYIAAYNVGGLALAQALADAENTLAQAKMCNGGNATTAAKPKPGDTIVGCGEVLTTSEQLGQDLVCPTDPALTLIGGRLNLDGHTVVCDGSGLGIVLAGEAAQLRNGSVLGCEVAVLVEGDGHHLVQGVTASVEDAFPDDDMPAEGIRVASDHNRLLENRVLLGGTNAIRVNGDRNRIVRNRLTRAERGIRVDGERNQIARNLIRRIAEGVEVRGERNRIRRNRIVGALDQGIEVRGDDNRVVGNFAADSEADGISIFSSDNVVRRNRIFSNADDGIIVIDGNGGNDLADNRTAANGTDLTDQNRDCGDNLWTGNTFETADPADCID
jgi:parallel beta-helix repeat protein